MSVNFQPFFNAVLPLSPLSSSNSAIYGFYLECQHSTNSKVIYSSYTFANVLLCPLYILILYMYVQRWRRQSSAPAGSTSRADFFTFHLAVVEICGVLGSVFYTLGMFTNSNRVSILGVFVFCIIFPGQTLLHCLTCVELYLAVVHPITYLRLRERGGVRIRNVSIGCVWLMCLVWVVVTKAYMPYFPLVPFICLGGFSLIVTLFCCFSVLLVLTRPGPGEVGGDKERVDQSKLRAFRIIMAIAGVLLLKFVGFLLCFGLYSIRSISPGDACALMESGLLLSLPSSLVLPLMFLHRAGKLSCCRPSAESG